MPHDPNDTVALFEETASWQEYGDNPWLQERSRVIRSMLEAVGASSLIDVGCGDGTLLRSLAAAGGAHRLRLAGCDPSRTALATFAASTGAQRIPSACARGETLPYRAGAADVVACLEVLEHLPGDALRATAAELARVAGRFLLVATPDREDPMRNALRCPRCGLVFNRSHHVQSFDARRLARLFPDFEVRDSRRLGQPVRGYPAPLLWLRHRVARRYFKGPGETRGLCPRCGNRDFPPFRHNLLSILLDSANRIASPRRPYWILLLLERRQGGSIGSA